MSQVFWDGGGAEGQWSDPLNWSTDLLPGSHDHVVLDNSMFIEDYTIVILEAVQVLTIRIAPAPGRTIELILPPANREAPGIVATGPGYGLTIGNGGVFRNASGAESGTPVDISDSIKIENGGRYIHNTARSHAANVQVLSRAHGTELGIMEFDIPDASSTLSFSGRSYGTLILKAERAGGSLNYTAAGTNGLTIRGNWVIESGVQLSMNFSDTINVMGDILLNGGTVNLGNTSRSVVVDLKGHLRQSADAVITETGAGVQQVRLSGEGIQEIEMDGEMLNEIAFVKDGSSVARILRPLTLPYRLELREGVVNTASALLTLGPACRVVADTLSSESYVEGPLKKTGLDESAFTFPVGDGGRMRWLSVTEATGDFLVEYQHDEPLSIAVGVGPGIEHVSALEYWKLGATGPGARARLKLSFYDPHSGGVTRLDDLRVARALNGTWTNAGNEGIGGAAGANGWVTSTAIDVFSSGDEYFSLASAVSNENPLPLSLIDFDAKREGRQVSFAWAVSDADGTEVFEVERSYDRLNFELIGECLSEKGRRQYTYGGKIDGADMGKDIYYRLRIMMNDRDRPVLSRIVRIAAGSGEDMALKIGFDAKGLMNIRAFGMGQKQSNLVLQIVDYAGRCVSVCRITTDQLAAGHGVPVGHLLRGIYVVVVQGSGIKRAGKFVKTE